MLTSTGVCGHWLTSVAVWGPLLTSVAVAFDLAELLVTDTMVFVFVDLLLVCFLEISHRGLHLGQHTIVVIFMNRTVL